jgi:anaerobic ribonucleoside-triphosphate reductase
MERVEGLDAHLREESLNIKTVQKLCKNLEERERERERERELEREEGRREGLEFLPSATITDRSTSLCHLTLVAKHFMH